MNNKPLATIGAVLSMGALALIVVRIVASILAIKNATADSGIVDSQLVAQSMASTYTTCIFAAIIAAVGVAMLLSAGRARENPEHASDLDGKALSDDR